MDYSLPRSSLHGILQARVLEWVAISFSRGSSQLRDGTGVSYIPADALTSEPPEKPHTAQLTVVAVLYTRSPEFTHPVAGSCIP